MCHLVNMSYVILSTCHFVNVPFCQRVILSMCYFVNVPFCQCAVLSMCHFVNMSFSCTERLVVAIVTNLLLKKYLQKSSALQFHMIYKTSLIYMITNFDSVIDIASKLTFSTHSQNKALKAFS